MARGVVRARFLRSLHVERLEERAVPAASITASLSAGVLTVNGTTKNDSIVLRQASSKLSIDGVSTKFSATAVDSIVVKTGAGNDKVSLSGLNPWTKQITVNSSAGKDSIKLLTGKSATLNGANKSLVISATVVPPPTPPPSPPPANNDWFESNITDVALRQLLRQGFSDGAVSRNEVLGVFNQAKQDGTVSSTELNDLKAMANNTSLFGSVTYVADITKSVVLGNAANAKFQGTTLGNLAANDTGAKLDKLVGKWFLGADRPDAAYNGVTVTYATASGSLFGAGGPKYTDVVQGAVGDCYYVGTLAEIAQQSPSTITSMFIVNGDGTYGVRFYNNGQQRYVTVDSKLPTYGGGYLLYANMGQHVNNSSNVLWVALAEKAYVQMNEAGWLRPSNYGGGQNSYQAIAGGWFSDVTAQVANRIGTNYYVGASINVSTFESAYNSGKMIGFGSITTPSNSSIVGNHQYLVSSYNSATKMVTLFNPWGDNNGSQYPGHITLSLSQLSTSFNYWATA